ncbi:unnamed protein product [Miscanthus lutarioriparius]|uniref:O-fucosyltransferase family protein n=1 Tax=Miscanthus lutarioriparius TaxID=422564 RepID=A0A811Q8J2_9POAL|nr:unnamed protein product [Miscanthus lutarioriparius]
MAELRHSTAARASNSPAKRDSDASAASSPFLASPTTHGSRGGGGGDDDDGKDAHRSSPLLSHHHRPPADVPVPLPPRTRGPQVPRRLVLLPDPACPPRAPPRRRDLLRALALVPPHVPSVNETSGYIFIHAEGGLNQLRIAICNAVAIAKIMRATLILPVLKQDQILKDQSKFEDIFDVDHFINYFKDDVRIVRDIPDWFTEKDELFTSIK